MDERSFARHPILVVAVALAIAALSGATGVGDNDAGSGADAGNTWQTATAIAQPGAYEGNLTSGDPADWYVWHLDHHTRFPTCTQAALTTNTIVDATLDAVNGETGAYSAVKAQVLLAGTTRIGVVTAGADGGLLDVSPDALSPGVQSDYHFALSTMTPWTMPSGDGGSGQDAGSTPATAVALSPTSACFGGRVGAAGDASDMYSFTENAGSRVTVTLADTTGNARGTLTDAAGNVLATVLSGGLATAQLPTTGTYYFTASAPPSTFGTLYLGGLCDPQCGPPQEPCNPMCNVLFSD